MLRRRASAAPDPLLALFASGEQGAYSYPTNAKAADGDYINFTDAGGTIPAGADDIVRFIRDLTGNDNHFTQSDIDKGFALRTNGSIWWWDADGVDDYYVGGPVHGTVKEAHFALRRTSDLDRRFFYGGRSSSDLRLYFWFAVDNTINLALKNDTSVVNSFVISANTDLVFGGSYDGSNEVLYNQETVIDTNSKVLDPTPGIESYLGTFNNSGAPLGDYFQGRIYSFFDIDRLLTAAERSTVVSDAKARAGI